MYNHLFHRSGGTSAAKEKEKFEKEKAKLTSELDSMKQRLANAINYQQELDAKCTAAEEQISKYEEMIEVCIFLVMLKHITYCLTVLVDICWKEPWASLAVKEGFVSVRPT